MNGSTSHPSIDALPCISRSRPSNISRSNTGIMRAESDSNSQPADCESGSCMAPRGCQGIAFDQGVYCLGVRIADREFSEFPMSK
jgi:hypothetical protein